MRFFDRLVVGQIAMSGVLAAQTPAAPAVPRIAPTDSNVVFGNVGNAALLLDVFRPTQPNGLGILFISGSGWGGMPSYTHGYDDIPLKNDARNPRGYEGRLVQGLVARGYTVFSVNHRFAPESRFPGPMYDAQRAVRYVRNEAAGYGVDPMHLGAIGHSSGGHLASLLGAIDTTIDNPRNRPWERGSSQVQAVVTLAAPFDLTEVNTGKPDNVRVVTNLVGALPPPSRGRLQANAEVSVASPITRFTTRSAPVLIYHAEDDSLILQATASAMAARLASLGVAHKLVMRASGGHSPSYDLDEIDAWFQRYLK